MAKRSAIGKCALCGKRRVLRRSHLMPKSLYAMTRVQKGKIAENPILITQRLSVQSSKQVRAHLLCNECEDRFNKGGENYSLTQVHDGIDFPLLDRMNVAMPVQVEPRIGVSLYSASAMGVSWEKLAYFALSIFWRASVHRWPLPAGGTIWNSLGPHEPAVRSYLLGKGTFPLGLVLMVTVCTDWQSQGGFWSPALVVGSTIPSLGLLTRGIHFRLFLASNLPPDIKRLCIATGSQHFIAMGNCRKISEHAYVHLMKTSREAASLSKTLRAQR